MKLTWLVVFAVTAVVACGAPDENPKKDSDVVVAGGEPSASSDGPSQSDGPTGPSAPTALPAYAMYSGILFQEILDLDGNVLERDDQEVEILLEAGISGDSYIDGLLSLQGRCTVEFVPGESRVPTQSCAVVYEGNEKWVFTTTGEIEFEGENVHITLDVDIEVFLDQELSTAQSGHAIVIYDGSGFGREWADSPSELSCAATGLGDGDGSALWRSCSDGHNYALDCSKTITTDDEFWCECLIDGSISHAFPALEHELSPPDLHVVAEQSCGWNLPPIAAD